MAEVKDAPSTEEAPPVEETITDPGTTLGAPTPADSGITDPGTTLGTPIVEEPKSKSGKESE